MKVLSIFFVTFVAFVSIHPMPSFATELEEDEDADGSGVGYADWEASLLEAGYTQVAWAEEGGAIFEWTASNGNVLIAWWDNGPQAEVYDPNGNCISCGG
jgi:hypothetical protein